MARLWADSTAAMMELTMAGSKAAPRVVHWDQWKVCLWAVLLAGSMELQKAETKGILSAAQWVKRWADWKGSLWVV